MVTKLSPGYVEPLFSQLLVFNLSLLKVLLKRNVQRQPLNWGLITMATEMWWLKRGRMYSPLSFLPAVIFNLCGRNPVQNIDCDQLLRNYICIFINWYKYHTIKEDLIPWIGWQTLGTLDSIWRRNNRMLCSKTWINGKPLFMLLQRGVNERTKHSVSLWRKRALSVPSTGLSAVWNTVNTKVAY